MGERKLYSDRRSRASQRAIASAAATFEVSLSRAGGIFHGVEKPAMEALLGAQSAPFFPTPFREDHYLVTQGTLDDKVVWKIRAFLMRIFPGFGLAGILMSFMF